MKPRSLVIGLLLTLASPLAASAQCSGQPGAGFVCGNPAPVKGLPSWAAFTTYLDTFAPSTPRLLTNNEVLIDTRNLGTPYGATCSEAWSVDGYRIAGCGGTPGVFQVFQTTPGPDESFPNALLYQQLVRNIAPTPTDNYHIEQWIEPALATPLQMGSAGAQTFTYSWYQACSVTPVIQSVAFLPGDNTRFFVSTATYNATVNTYQRLWIVVPGDTTLTSSYRVNGFKIIHDLGWGTAWEQTGSSTAWTNTATKFRVAGSFNLIQAPTAVICLVTGVQIDFGTQPRPFRHLDFQSYLFQTQRYICKGGSYSAPAKPGQGNSSAVTYAQLADGVQLNSVQFTCPVEMLNPTPSVNLYNPVAGGTAGRWGNLSNSTDSGVAAGFFVNSRSVTLVNDGDAGDLKNQLNGIGVWLGSCVGGC